LAAGYNGTPPYWWKESYSSNPCPPNVKATVLGKKELYGRPFY